MKDSRLQKLAYVLVNYSVGVKKGDFVFIKADHSAKDWVVEVTKESIKAGGHVETCITSEEISEAKLKYSSDEQLKENNYMLETMLEKADVFLTAWGHQNTKFNSKVNSEKIRLSTIGNKKWRSIYSKRMGDGTLRWCGTQFPTHSDAQEASMSLSDYEDFVYGAGLLDKADPISEWKKVNKLHEKWVNYLNAKKELHIVSKGTDIKVGIKDRKWISCAGKENFPDGEIFTSPEEDKINGVITFSFPGIYAGKEVEGIKLEVSNGKVINAEAEKGKDLLDEILKTDEGSSFFGEVAIGTNYGIKDFTRNMLFDEKIGGTVHMAIGDSMLEAGGKNKSVVHWDMLCDMRTNGKIYADGELFYENGNFIDLVLKK